MLRVSPAFPPGTWELAGLDELEARYELSASESDDEDEYDEDDEEDENEDDEEDEFE